MALIRIPVTIPTPAAQVQVSTLLSAGTKVCELFLFARSANTGAIGFDFATGVKADGTQGYVLAKGTISPIFGPFDENLMDLVNLFVIGTAADIVDVYYVQR